jgi:hypothetical protein
MTLAKHDPSAHMPWAKAMLFTGDIIHLSFLIVVYLQDGFELFKNSGTDFL